MQRTNIEWTDFSAALLKYRDPEGKVVHACVKCSPGCANCYAEGIANRFERRRFTLPMTRDTKPFFDDREAGLIRRSKKIAGGMMFINDMTDLFGDWVSDAIIDNHFRLFAERPDVTFQILTKRSARMRDYCANRWGTFFGKSFPPLPHVWLGTSVEDQQRADERIPHLLAVPAAVRFLSCEPLLGPLDIRKWLIDDHTDFARAERYPFCLDWLIAGGESGPNARPMHPDWPRSLRDQCTAAGVPFFFKQWGEWAPREEPLGRNESLAFHRFKDQTVYRLGKKPAGRLLDGREWSEFPATRAAHEVSGGVAQ